MNQKAFVLLSGGMDSTTCLHMAVDAVGSNNVNAISIDYGQRHKDKELQCARLQTTQLNCSHFIWDASNIMPQTGMLTDLNQTIPDVSYEDLPDGISPTYVPFRNGFLLATLAAIAMSKIGDEQPPIGKEHLLFYGAHAEDSANWAYPDCTPEFAGAMSNAIFIGTYQRCRLVTPLQWMAKSEIVEAGSIMNINWQNTWSCYKGEDLQCGTCPTCIARKEAFRDSGYVDPTEYAA